MRNRLTLYFTLAVIAFLIATAGSDTYAQMVIGGQQLRPALSEHFHWAWVQFIGTVLLFLPFGFLATIGSWTERNTSQWRALLIFGLPTLFLIYAYFEGYQASKVAELDKRWTSATLEIGFLPFWAVPVVFVTWLTGYIVVRTQRKSRDARPGEKD